MFANSRRKVELFAAELADRSAAAQVPNEFHAHHGNLSMELRQDVEELLRDPSRPATTVCTSTLEMGIDIGSVAQVAQVGPPPSVAALRQRLGRAGRRGDPAVLRAYLATVARDARSTVLDRLQVDLVQFIAAIDLLLERWCEPSDPARLHLSTLVQQFLSLLAQHDGATPAEAFRVLCGRGSPFSAVTSMQFATLLRDLGGRDVLVQSSDGTLLLGPRGEAVVNHYTFYAAFQSPEEYRLVSAGRQLGTMPIDFPLFEGSLMVFSGRRWRVAAIHEQDKVVELVPAPEGRPPFTGDASGSVHGEVRARMRELLEVADVPPYLDACSADLLRQARREYASLRLDSEPFLADGSDTLVIPVGDVTAATVPVGKDNVFFGILAVDTAARSPPLSRHPDLGRRTAATTATAAISALTPRIGQATCPSRMYSQPPATGPSAVPAPTMNWKLPM